MTALTDRELRRARWRRYLATQGLDVTDREDFALGGLGGRVGVPTARLLLLPSDPDVERFTFDSEFWVRLDALKTVTLEEFGQVRLGQESIPTAHAAALVHPYGDKHPWDSYVALHRNGSTEVGFGNHSRWTDQREGKKVRVFNLMMLVRYSEAALELTRNLAHEPDGEWHLTLALAHTRGALLGGLADGWTLPGSLGDRSGGCTDEHLLWHIELDHLPANATESQELAFAIGDRIENAWGTRKRRYLAYKGMKF